MFMDNPTLVAVRLVALADALADADADLSRARDAASSARFLVATTDLAADFALVLGYLDQALALIARARPDARALTTRAAALDSTLAAELALEGGDKSGEG